MNKGERFSVSGYDIVAAAFAARGGGPPDTEEFLVLNNNSTHFLVAKRESHKLEAVLIDTYQYYDTEVSAVLAYRKALMHMTDQALRH